ncbi:MAG: sugar phosphate isomerase/epimerase [Planctomycetaceae bacterium]|nr:sugar phosphate isomerase/epimerase [Planctomycetaceae bacterium]
MNRLRLAVATSRFSSSLREVVRMAAETGASGLQFDARQQLKPTDLSETGRRQLLHSLGERDLSVASLTMPLRLALYDEEYLDVRIEAIKQAMQFAWDLKARVLTCRIGRIPGDDAVRERSRLQEVLGAIASHGNHVGVTFSITPAGDSPDVLRSLIESVNTGPLGIDFDPAERVMSRLDPVKSLRELHAHVTHMTVRDAIRDVDGSGREVPVGRGECQWPDLLALVDEMNYAGWLTADRTAGNDPFGDVRRAVQFVRNVVHQ